MGFNAIEKSFEDITVKRAFNENIAEDRGNEVSVDGWWLFP